MPSGKLVMRAFDTGDFQPVQRAFEILMMTVTASSVPIEKLRICVRSNYEHFHESFPQSS